MEWKVNGKRIKIVGIKRLFGQDQIYYTIEGKVNKMGPRQGEPSIHRMMKRAFFKYVGIESLEAPSK